MLRAEEPRIIRATIVTATAIEVLGDEAIVVLIVRGVVLSDFVIRDLCKVLFHLYVRKVYTCASSIFFTTEFRKFWGDILLVWLGLSADILLLYLCLEIYCLAQSYP